MYGITVMYHTDAQRGSSIGINSSIEGHKRVQAQTSATSFGQIVHERLTLENLTQI